MDNENEVVREREGLVKTTVEIDEGLHKALKIKAARKGTSLKALIVDAVERSFYEERENETL